MNSTLSASPKKLRSLFIGGQIFLALVSALAQPAGESYLFTHLAGSLGGPGRADGTGATARFYYPNSVAVDHAGNLYVADSGNNTIRKITPAGVVTTLAGAAGVSGSANGTGATARFDYPFGVAADNAGNVYVADSSNHTIRKIAPGGVVTTLAGTAGVSGSADGTGTAASFSSPRGVAVDSAGNIYVADYSNHTIRKITPGGGVTTLAGTAGVSGHYSGDDGTGEAARFTYPSGVAVDAAGNVYVADSGSKTIRKITPDGVVTTLAGVATVGVSSSIDGLGAAARFNSPSGVTVDNAGNVYVAEPLSPTIRKVTPAGMVTTFAGMVRAFGHADGTGADAQFNYPAGVAVDAAGNLYVSDIGTSVTEGGNFFIEEENGGTIRKITPAGVVTTVAGTAVTLGSTDGSGAAAQFYFPFGVTVDNAGSVYVADEGNSTIRKITPGGAVTTLAGTAGVLGSADGTGADARFNHPHGLAVDNAGNLYVSDLMTSHFYGTTGGTIRKVTPGGVVTTVAGLATFNNPYGIAVDRAGNVYLADTGTTYIDRIGVYHDGTAGNTIHKITPAGDVTILAGTAGAHGSADGTGAAARFFEPRGLAVDGFGSVYVADQNNHTIRKITPGGVVTTLAGSAGQRGSADGIGAAARFFYPEGLAVDSAGNVYVADQYNHTIRKVTPDGVTTTLGGTAGAVGSADGIGTAAGFNVPTSVAVDSAGNLYVADYYNHAIRKGQPGGPPVIMTQPLSQSVAAGANVQFSVNASSIVALTYQWYLNGSPFSGATSNTLSFTNARNSDAGDYTVVVANELGTITSNKATLTVSPAPVTPLPSTPTSGGGGGSIEGWFVLAVFVLSAARHLATQATSLSEKGPCPRKPRLLPSE